MEMDSGMENYIKKQCSDNCGDVHFPLRIHGHGGKQASR